MGRRTRKVGITGKWGTRYGSSIRKVLKKTELTQHASYVCPFCGKDNVRRVATGIWQCRSCKKVMAGGAYMLSTPAAVTVRTAVNRLRRTANE